jgi:hypothetical protein
MDMVPVRDGEGSFLEVNKKQLHKKLEDLGFIAPGRVLKGDE